MSLEHKVSLDHKVLGLLAMLGSAGPGCADDEHSINLGGVAIKERITDSEGAVSFTDDQTGEDVEVKVTAFGNPVPDTTVIFFDNHLSEGFLLSHPAFAPRLEVALHNSGHEYSLTPAPLQISYNSFKKERSKPGAKKFHAWAAGSDWAAANWEYTGCLDRENMLTLMKPTVYMLNKIDISSLGVSERDLDEAAEYIEEKLPASATAEVYSFTPAKYGFRATTTITALVINFEGGCKENNQSDTEEYGCEGMLFCDYFNGTYLDQDKWSVINDAGINVGDGWLRLYDSSSIGTKKEFAETCPAASAEVKGSLDGGALYLGGDIALYAANGMAQLLCGEKEVISFADFGSASKINLEKNGETLSLRVNGTAISSLPCSSTFSRAHLTAGFGREIELDYVEVNCR